MISLKKILEQAIKEAIPPVSPAANIPQQMPQQQDPSQQQMTPGAQQQKKILDFPKHNFTVSIFPNERKLIFAAKKGSIKPTNLRETINFVRNTYMVNEIKYLKNGVFQIILRATENMGQVSDGIQQFVEKLK